MTIALLWLQLLLCCAVIGFAGPKLIRYCDVIADHTGLSRSWTGVALLATATSLPELFTGISAVTVADAPNIAVGDALGSCTFNLVLLVLLDELSRTEPMYRRIDRSHVLTAAFGIVLIGAAGVFLLLSRNSASIQFAHISGYTPLIFLLYLVAMRASFVHQARSRPVLQKTESKAGMTIQRALISYLLAAAAIAGAGLWLPFIGKEIAAAIGWQTSFVGTILIAGATSLPELVVSVSALRLRAVDMAIGGLLGSNLFDILILGIDDLAFTAGPLLAHVSLAHAITAFAGVIMSGIFIIAVLYEPQTIVRRVINWASLALLVVYMFSSYAVYVHSH